VQAVPECIERQRLIGVELKNPANGLSRRGVNIQGLRGIEGRGDWRDETIDSEMEMEMREFGFL